MKDWKSLFLLLAVLLFGFTSCDDTVEVGEYDNWQKKNDAFIDSIASVVRNSNDGSWKRFLVTGLDESREWGNEYYVYCYIMQAGNGTEHPAYTDYVNVNYRGSLIPSKSYPKGFIFDSSYEGELEPEFDVPTTLKLSDTVAGFYTAVQQMVAGTTQLNGDIWRIYIPYNLGYGVHEKSGIPAYSTLIFDVNLVSFYSKGIE